MGFMSSSGGEKFSVVMFDIDSKDATIGLSCPPRPFLDRQFLQSMRDNCLQEQGTHCI